MPTPDFIQELRQHIGSQELWIPGVSAVVLRNQLSAGPDTETKVPEVLLVKRSDNGQWTVTSGILDPGEDPAPAGAREIEEETGVIAEPVRLAGIWAKPPTVYPNGDRCRYLDVVMEFNYVSGESRVNDDESTEVRWFRVDALPETLREDQRKVIDWALDSQAPARFMN